MTDRDYFAAAALTRGMGVLGFEHIAKSCYEMADAMLRERGTPVSDNCVAGNQPEIGCPTNHDAAPAAKASPQSVAPQPRGHGTGDISDAAPIAQCDTDAAMLREREKTASPSGSGSGGPINRSAPERQSPASDCGGGEPLDVCVQTMGSAPGGRGHNTPDAKSTPGECASQVGCTLTDDERAAVSRAAAWLVKAAESRRELHSAGYLCEDAATLRSLLERLA